MHRLPAIMRLNFSSLYHQVLVTRFFPLYCRYLRQAEADYKLTLPVVTLLGWFVLVLPFGNLKLLHAWFWMSE